MSYWRVTKLRQNRGLRARVGFPTHNRHAIRDGQAERVVCSHEFCELDDRGARTNCNKKRTLGTRCTQLPPAQLPTPADRCSAIRYPAVQSDSRGSARIASTTTTRLDHTARRHDSAQPVHRARTATE